MCASCSCMWLVTPRCPSCSHQSLAPCHVTALLAQIWSLHGAITRQPPLNPSREQDNKQKKKRNHPTLLKHHKGHRRGEGRKMVTQLQGCLFLRLWLSSKRLAPALQRCPFHARLPPASPAMPPITFCQATPSAPGRAATGMGIGAVVGSQEKDRSRTRRKLRRREIIRMRRMK